MINPFEFIKAYTIYDGSRLLLLIVAIYAVVVGYLWINNRDRRFITMITTSILVAIIVPLITPLVYSLSGSTIPLRNQTIYVMTHFINAISLFIYAVDFVKEQKDKRPDMDHVNRKHFKESIQIGLLITSFSVIIMPFVETGLLIAISNFGISAIIVLAVNHILARRVFFDPNDIK